MGATFSEPTYFYEEGTKPDLVDTYGPIYSRTGMNLSNIIPTKVITSGDPNSTGGSLLVNGRILTHDLHIITDTYSPIPNDTEEPIKIAKLCGYVDITQSVSSLTTIKYPVIQFMFEHFTLDGYTVGGGVASANLPAGEKSYGTHHLMVNDMATVNLFCSLTLQNSLTTRVEFA